MRCRNTSWAHHFTGRSRNGTARASCFPGRPCPTGCCAVPTIGLRRSTENCGSCCSPGIFYTRTRPRYRFCMSRERRRRRKAICGCTGPARMLSTPLSCTNTSPAAGRTIPRNFWRGSGAICKPTDMPATTAWKAQSMSAAGRTCAGSLTTRWKSPGRERNLLRQPRAWLTVPSCSSLRSSGKT